MNILVTTVCNRRECDFCFEQSVPGLRASGMRDAPPSFITRERYRRLIGIAADDWGTRVCLLGGEPTQHPEICGMVDDALELGLHVLITTNGVIAPATAGALQQRLSAVSAGRLTFLVNAHLRPHQPSGELRTIRANLAWMGPAAALSLTIVDTSFDLFPLALLALEFRLSPRIRVSLSHPMLDQRNAYLSRGLFRDVGRRLMAQGRDLRAAGLRLTCDCGFVACMFADEAKCGEPADAAIARGVGKLDACGIEFRSVCNPLPDVRHDLQAGHCLPLMSEVNVPFTSPRATSREALATELRQRACDGLSTFLFESCGQCGLRHSGVCTAGCVAHRRLIERAGG